MVSSARPAPRTWVGASACSSTSPSAVTRPAATVVPPTSTPMVTPLTAGTPYRFPKWMSRIPSRSMRARASGSVSPVISVSRWRP